MNSSEDRLARRKARFDSTKISNNAKETLPGFVSRGDSYLREKANQTQYWKQLCSQLPQQFDDVAIELNITRSASTELEGNIDNYLLNLRRLREAIVATRNSALIEKVFGLSIRIAARTGHYQTYVPAIGYLFACNRFDYEYVVYLIFHMVHCNQDYSTALRLYFTHLAQHAEYHYVLLVIQSWIVHDWVTWFKLLDSLRLNPEVHSIMNLGTKHMLKTMVKTMSLAYFTYPIADLYLPHGVNVEATGWKVDNEGSTAIIRERIKR